MKKICVVTGTRVRHIEKSAGDRGGFIRMR